MAGYLFVWVYCHCPVAECRHYTIDLYSGYGRALVRMAPIIIRNSGEEKLYRGPICELKIHTYNEKHGMCTFHLSFILYQNNRESLGHLAQAWSFSPVDPHAYLRTLNRQPRILKQPYSQKENTTAQLIALYMQDLFQPCVHFRNYFVVYVGRDFLSFMSLLPFVELMSCTPTTLQPQQCHSLPLLETPPTFMGCFWKSLEAAARGSSRGKSTRLCRWRDLESHPPFLAINICLHLMLIYALTL